MLDQAIGLAMYDSGRYAALGREASQQYLPTLLTVCPERWSMQQMRLRAVCRLPVAFGWLTRRGDAATRRWTRPVMTRPGIRRDAVRTLRAVDADARGLAGAAEALGAFDRPALVVWAAGDRVMPPAHGRRLAELLPQGRLAEIPDSRTLVPLDQPERLALAIREFVSAPHR